jgi:hypothetical protein
LKTSKEKSNRKKVTSTVAKRFFKGKRPSLVQIQKEGETERAIQIRVCHLGKQGFRCSGTCQLVAGGLQNGKMMEKTLPLIGGKFVRQLKNY